MLPMLDSRRCRGSGDCIRVCPTQCLEARPPIGVYLARPAECISCGLCMVVCPEQAIELPELLPIYPPSEATFEPLED
ncbi:MAG: ferredoxin family protein [Gemmataceae bacterium]